VKTAFLVAIACLNLSAATYYLAPASLGGNDSNSGTTAGAPWLTPNHSVNCGDVIVAAASNAYIGGTLNANSWGTVNCGGNHGVAWVQCVTFDACKSSTGIHPDQSHWGISGFEDSQVGGGCFAASPRTTTIIDIIFANDIANGCGGSGLTTYDVGNQGVDYVAIIGSISYNATTSSLECYSGINIFQPVPADTVPGTHIYIAGNFAFDNVNPNPCGGTAPTDGEGIIFDTLNGSGDGVNYTQQIVAENNITVFNGGRGISCCGNTNANIFFRNNTMYGNMKNVVGSCAEIYSNQTVNMVITGNLGQTTSNCSGAEYVFIVQASDYTSLLFNNWGYSSTGQNVSVISSPTFAAVNNLFGTSPAFVNPVDPGAPSCGAFASVPACMATVIANYTPTASGAAAYGYQIPGAPAYNPLYPKWLCNVTLPAGLVQNGCVQSGSPSASLR